MRRLLVRPPPVTLNTSFSDAYRANRFTQLELMPESDLTSEARKHGLTINRDTLEDLDRHGAFTPVAFAGANWHGGAYGPRWNIDALTFRDEVGYYRWSRYAFREDGFRRVLALYSPWQLMYLKSALEDRLALFTLPFLLGRRDRLIQAMKTRRPFWRIDRDMWASLEQNWRPVVLLLCWLQNRYLPFVRGQSTRVYIPDHRRPIDPVPDEVRSFDAPAFLDRVGLGIDDVKRIYEQLAFAGRTRDPFEDWYLVVRAAPPRAHDRFEGDARVAQLLYDAASVLRRFLYDLTGVVEPDCDEVFGDPNLKCKEEWLGHERRLYYDRDDFKKILERKQLSPYGVHVFVEGPSDKELIGGLIDAIWGDHRRLGIRFTVLRGIDQVARQEALFEAFSTYARKALLVADDEGKIARDLKRLQKAGLLIEQDSFHSWKRNIEEDNAKPQELVEIAKALAAKKGKRLKLSIAKLDRIRKAVGDKRGLARIICDDARQQGISISKVEIAVALRERIVAELKEAADEKPVIERRPVLGMALGIGRYSM
jgi:hypothetical protein